MLVNLDTDELWYLLEPCLRRSRLRSGTIERFVDEFYDKLSEHQRMNLFEWAVRLGYAWVGGKAGWGFNPSGACCDKEVIFMKRYHPENQYMVTTRRRWKHDDGKRHQVTLKSRAFLMDGKFYINSRQFCPAEYIVNVEHIDLHDKWEEHKVAGVDYDTNILES